MALVVGVGPGRAGRQQGFAFPLRILEVLMQQGDVGKLEVEARKLLLGL
jgi:hypothetical protein